MVFMHQVTHCMFSYIHCGVDLRDGLVIQRELVDLDAVADQLTHDFDLELVQLAFTDGVCFGDHWDDVHLQTGNIFMCMFLSLLNYKSCFICIAPAHNT